ncbi:hypothetical protein NUW54_g6405 [Trametes sanguinea]|uniref:Uncharacterized protein n=2 Tax=Trametes sanguinea TaxID=158606 RepID=A0ACC1PSC2_9APHY|nr:hypothetical protein NUW54_g6524 [Trametes sanguinea]KAJ3001462.1 hypothetical protein NUW54_g6405 [Trametes sanguinea]
MQYHREYQVEDVHNPPAAFSSFEDLGLIECEEAAIHSMTGPSDSDPEVWSVQICPDQIKRRRSAKTRHSKSAMAQHPVVRKSNKGKEHAVNNLGPGQNKDGDEDKDEDKDKDDMEGMEEDGGLPMSRITQLWRDEVRHLNANVVLLLFQKIEATVIVVQNFVNVVQASTESNKTFQLSGNLMMNDLKAIKGSVSSSGEQMAGVGGCSGPSTPSKKKSTPRKGSDCRVAKRIARVHGHDLDEDEDPFGIFKVCLRDFMIILLRSHAALIAKCFPLLTEDEIKSYTSENGMFICDPQMFWINFEHSWKKFSFNKKAREVVICTFLTKAESGTFANNPIPLARLYTVLNVPSLQCRQALCTRMSAVSSDETDGPEVQYPPVYRIIIAGWQSLELHTFLWRLDAWYIDAWEKAFHGRRTKGNPPKTQVF